MAIEGGQLTCGDCVFIDTPHCIHASLKPKRLPTDDDAIGCPEFRSNNIEINTSTPSSVYFLSNGKFIPKRLGDELLKEYRFATMSDTKELYVYEEGIYVQNGENIVREYVRKKLGERAKSHCQRSFRPY